MSDRSNIIGGDSTKKNDQSKDMMQFSSRKNSDRLSNTGKSSGISGLFGSNKRDSGFKLFMTAQSNNY